MEHYAVNLGIRAKQHRGRPCFELGKKGPLLVQRDNPSEPWRLVECLNQELGHSDLVRFFGCWTDREVSSGLLFWKTVTRPLDGEIQDDEVESFAWRVAYSWEHHHEAPSTELPHIEKLTLKLDPNNKTTVGTLSELWQRSSVVD